MNSDPYPESQPPSQNPENNPSPNQSNILRIELNSQQATYLNKLLPSYYSFQLDSKPLKRTTSTAKNTKDNTKMS